MTFPTYLGEGPRPAVAQVCRDPGEEGKTLLGSGPLPGQAMHSGPTRKPSWGFHGHILLSWPKRTRKQTRQASVDRTPRPEGPEPGNFQVGTWMCPRSLGPG